MPRLQPLPWGAVPWGPAYRSCWLGACGGRGAGLRLPSWLAGGRGGTPGGWLALLLWPRLWGLLGGLRPGALRLGLRCTCCCCCC